MTLIQAMQRQPAVTAPEATLRGAVRRMTETRMPLLPVLSGERLVGTLSVLDVTAQILVGAPDSDWGQVATLMRTDPPTCRPADSLALVRERLCALRLPALPVIEDEGRLVGLADLFDVQRALDAPSAAGPEPEMVRRIRGEAR
jgi:CBS domain-containing protein